MKQLLSEMRALRKVILGENQGSATSGSSLTMA